MSEEKTSVTPAAAAAPAAPPAPPVADIDILRIEMTELLSHTSELKEKGYRFVSLTCIDRRDDGFEVVYHFDKDLQLHNYSVMVPPGEELPSICSVFFCAFLVENEVGDHFGLKVKDLPLDFQHHLVIATTAEPAPLLKEQAQQ